MTDGTAPAALHWRAAQAALARGDIATGIVCLEQVVAADPADLEAYRALGRFLRLANRPDEAAAWYHRCLERAPGDAIASMGLVALGRAPAPPRLPDGVVLYVFDRNAPTYEENMRSLGYRVPEVLLAMLRDTMGTRAGQLDILDLGCGSGLCGPLLRPLARRLVGVDLAPRMLDLAREKRVYDELVEAELVDYLARTDDRFDAIVSANVLIYFGDLAPLLDGAARVLRGDGGLFFDVEKGEGAEPGFHVSGRYTHSRGLLDALLRERGLGRARIDETVMRTEAGTPVVALCCAAMRAADEPEATDGS